MVEEGILTRNQMIADDIIKTFVEKRLTYLDEGLVFDKFTRTFKFETGNTINILRAKESMEAQMIPEGAEIPSQFDMSESIEIGVNKYALTAAVSTETIEDARWDVLGDSLRNAMKGMAKKRNKVIGDVLLAGGLSGTGVGALTSWYTNETPPTYGANTFTSHTTHLRNLGTGIAISHFRDGVEHIAHHGYRADACLCNSAQIKDLLGLISTSSGNTTGYVPEKVYEEWFRTGKPLGNLYGLAVIQNDYVPAGMLLLVDSSAKPVGFAQKRTVKAKKFEDAQKDIVGSTFTERYGVKTIEKGAGYVIFNIS